MDEIFQTAPQEVMRYFEGKGLVPSYDWRDVAPFEHALSYTVAKTAGFDVLDDLHEATHAAIREQKNFKTFASELMPVLQEKGWWGRKIAYDPISGKSQIAQLGSLRRLRTIYWGNVSSARAAGEWERIQRTKDYLPYLRYGRSKAERHRLRHRQWEGTILPVDHGWWRTHYPPNGWLCQCPVRQMTKAQAEREGYDPEAGAPPIVTRRWLNRRTGKWHNVPEGIDPGWAQNPGATRARNLANFMGDRLSAMAPERRRIAIADLVGSYPFQQMADRRNLEQIVLPVAPMTEALRKMRPTTAEHIFLSSQSIKHILDEHGERGLKVEDFGLAFDFIATGQIKEPQAHSKGLVVTGNGNGRFWRAVIKVLRDEAYLVSFHDKGRAR